jgi:ornithine carbamoyltransferase
LPFQAISYQVDSKALYLAKGDVLFMHPLVARHGEEISGELLDDPRSVIFNHTENRPHLQKALLARIILCQISRAQTNDQIHYSYCGQN